MDLEKATCQIVSAAVMWHIDPKYEDELHEAVLQYHLADAARAERRADYRMALRRAQKKGPHIPC